MRQAKLARTAVESVKSKERRSARERVSRGRGDSGREAHTAIGMGRGDRATKESDIQGPKASIRRGNMCGTET